MSGAVEAQKQQADKLERAFQLAFFIIGSRESAEKIAVEAVDRLYSAVVTQDRRYYYIPQGSSRQLGRSTGTRNKVNFNELHLLQRLVYDGTEAFERAQESAGFDDQRLLIHYLKHLVRITIKRNSFYVSLGVTRFLHRYSITEAMAFYNVVMQDPNRVKDNYYWRSRKGRLLQEIKTRFGDLLAVTRGAYGEERFTPRPDQARYANFVSQSLQILMPWETPCPLPADEWAVNGEIPELRFDADDPDKEHRTEIARIHAALHSECFRRLIAGLGFDSPESRLDLPEFFHPEMHNQNLQRTMGTTSGSQFIETMVELDQINTSAMRARLTELQALRQTSQRNSRQIEILVDRQQRALLDLDSTSQSDFNLFDGEEFIEIRSVENPDVCLALYPIDYVTLQQTDSTQNFDIELANGQKLRFALTPERDEFSEVTGASVTVNYDGNPTSISGWLASFWQSLESSVSALLSPKQAAPVLRYGTLAALLTIGGLSAFAIWKTLQPESSNQVAVNLPEKPTTGNPPVLPNGDKASNPNSPSLPGALPSPQRPPSTLRDPDVADNGAVPVVESPAQTRKVFLSSNRESEELQTEITNRLKSARLWELTDKDEADTALSISLSPDGRTASVELLNTKGKVIWPRSGKRRTYTGEAAQIAEKIVGDLKTAVRQ